MSTDDDSTGPHSWPSSSGDGVKLTIGGEDSPTGRRRWPKRVGLVILVLAVGAAGVLGLTELRSVKGEVDEIAAELEALRADNEDLRQEAETLRQDSEVLANAVVRLQEQLAPSMGAGLQDRIDEMEDALFGFTGAPSFTTGYIYDLEDSIAQLESCVDSLVSAWRFGSNYVFC